MNLSIIIPTWNTAEITLKCIKTIQKYIKNFSYEIIVVDNGSTDDTLKVLSSTKVKIIKNKKNLGFAKANNQAVKIAQGEYFLFLNSDMELINSSLIDMFNFIKNDPQIGLIGPQFLNTDLTPQSSVFPPQTALNAFREFWLNQKNSYSKYTPQTEKPIKVWAVSGGCILTRKSFFKSIGGWNEKYFFYFEDLDLCRKINKMGKDVIYFPQCQIIHRHGASGIKLADPSNQWRRLIPGSKMYHGLFEYYLINSILWSGQKWQNIKK